MLDLLHVLQVLWMVQSYIERRDKEREPAVGTVHAWCEREGVFPFGQFPLCQLQDLTRRELRRPSRWLEERSISLDYS